MRFSLLLFFLCSSAFAATTAPKKTTPSVVESASTFPFSFRNAEAIDVLAAYTKLTGQKFVIDGNLKGKLTILNPGKVNSTEAFNLLSSSLAATSIAISEQGDTMVVRHARAIQRDFIPVITELPSMKPERMVSYVIDLKHIDADEVNKQLRLITSSDGEVFPFGKNKLIITDWVSNLYRVKDLIEHIDQPGYQASKKTTEKSSN